MGCASVVAIASILVFLLLGVIRPAHQYGELTRRYAACQRYQEEGASWSGTTGIRERFQLDIAVLALAFVISCGLAALVSLTIAVF